MKVNLGLLVVQIVFLFAVFAGILFVAAGTVAWAAAWVFLILFFGFTITLSAWLVRNNPALLTERMGGNIQKQQEKWDQILIGIVTVVFIVWLLIMPLDAMRFHWSQMPAVLQVVGAVLPICSFPLFFAVFRENSYLSPVVRVQEERGHSVITTGPYHYVRHPMYAAVIPWMVGISLLLGSWLGLLFGIVLLLLIARRAVMEESTLRQELQGYDAYMQQVKYRLIPYVW